MTPRPAHPSAHPGFSTGEVAAIGLLVAIALGAGVFLLRQSARARASHAAASARHERLLADLQAEHTSLLAARDSRATATETAAPAAPPARPTAGQVLIDVAEFFDEIGLRQDPRVSMVGLLPGGAPRPGVQLPAYSIDATGTLPAGFGQLFGLDERAVAGLQERIHSIRDRVAATVAARTTMQQPSADTIVLTVESTGEAGEALRQEYKAALGAALGPDGMRALTILSRERETNGVLRGPITDQFEQFGTFGRTITITRSGGQYVLEDVRANGGRGRSSGASFERIRERYGPALKLVPEGF